MLHGITDGVESLLSSVTAPVGKKSGVTDRGYRNRFRHGQPLLVSTLRMGNQLGSDHGI